MESGYSFLYYRNNEVFVALLLTIAANRSNPSRNFIISWEGVLLLCRNRAGNLCAEMAEIRSTKMISEFG